MKISKKNKVTFFRVRPHFQANNVLTCLAKNWSDNALDIYMMQDQFSYFSRKQGIL